MKYKSKKDLETSSSSSLCPCTHSGWGKGTLRREGFARLCLLPESAPVSLVTHHGAQAGNEGSV